MKYSFILNRYIVLFSLLSLCFAIIFPHTVLAREAKDLSVTKNNKLNTHIINRDNHFKMQNKITSTTNNFSTHFYHDKENNSKNTRIIAPLQKEKHYDTNNEITITPEIYIPIRPK